MMTRNDRAALVMTGLVALPIAAGLLWAGATAPTTSDVVVVAMFLVAWLIIALPVAVLVGRFVDRHAVPFAEEEDEILVTTYLARKVVDGEVDETTSVYLGRCDVTDCRYLVDHKAAEVVEDALDGHARRVHATTPRGEDTSRTGWIPAWSYGPIASDVASTDAAAPAWAPSPTPREENP